MSRYEEAYRNVVNLAAEFASLVTLLPVLEKAKDAEKFLAGAPGEISKRQNEISRLEKTIGHHQAEVNQLKGFLLNAKDRLDESNTKLAKAESDHSTYLAKTQREGEQFKAKIDQEIQLLVSQREKLKVELQQISTAVQSARSEQQAIQENIKRANAALRPS